MSSTLRSSLERQEESTPHLRVVPPPSEEEEIKGQIDSGRSAVKETVNQVIPPHYNPDFTVEELLAEPANPPVRNEYNFHPSDWRHEDPALQAEEEEGLWGRGID